MRRRELDGPEADLYSPAHGRASPGIVILLGAVLEGRRYPPLVGLAEAVARAGYAVLVPELGRLRELVLDRAAVADAEAAVRLLRAQPEVRPGPVGLYGFSVGASVALLAAAEDRDGAIAFVAGLGAYLSLPELVAGVGDGTEETTRLVLERSLAAADAGAAPPSFDELSPDRVLDRVRCPVWLLHDLDDGYVPATQTLSRAADLRRRGWWVGHTRVISHTEFHSTPPTPRNLVSVYAPDLWRLFEFAAGPLRRLP